MQNLVGTPHKQRVQGPQSTNTRKAHAAKTRLPGNLWLGVAPRTHESAAPARKRLTLLIFYPIPFQPTEYVVCVGSYPIFCLPVMN